MLWNVSESYISYLIHLSSEISKIWHNYATWMYISKADSIFQLCIDDKTVPSPFSLVGSSLCPDLTLGKHSWSVSQGTLSVTCSRKGAHLGNQILSETNKARMYEEKATDERDNIISGDDPVKLNASPSSGARAKVDGIGKGCSSGFSSFVPIQQYSENTICTDTSSCLSSSGLRHLTLQTMPGNTDTCEQTLHWPW